MTGIVREHWGTLANGDAVEAVVLRTHKLEMRVLTLGALVQSLRVPDRNGTLADIVLGHDAPQAYLDKRQFFGAAIGRFSNRLDGAAFVLDGKRHSIESNDGDNVLHGGPEGFDRKLWRIDQVEEGAEPAVTLSLVSPDGDQGFPGTLHASVTYRLAGESEVSITFEATSDQPTVVGLTHHGYFNLGGVEALAPATSHVLQVEATHFLPVGANLIPHGGPEPLVGTPFDFGEAKPIERDLRRANAQLLHARGYDHCFCLSDAPQAEPRLAATLQDPRSGRVLQLLTDQPGLQVYSGNMLDGSTVGKYNQIIRPGDAVCLEPQAWPDAPNRHDFPSARLDPGAAYRHRSVYRFSAR
ncbi:aldose epimerase family protein [Tianweitania sediminis]|uniref:Aldose 1-epimerase n=1 Tax=Tianweitania sediminis TaxID=1502156 RepID=A0A8J7R3K3_9HYPH|nr:aldose epimerase family protein [Tianweitania sediminis]MBP0441122.1 galactose mutarotase [Tianweitania sediminis]